MGALAKATGFDISSSILSNIPQNIENGSRVSGAAPKLTYDSPISVPDDDDEEYRGDKIGSRVREVDAIWLGPGRSLIVGSELGGRIANGGRPLEGEIRVARRNSQLILDHICARSEMML